MTLNEAKELAHLFARIGEQLNQSVGFVQYCDDESRFLQYREFVGKLMGDLFLDGMQPLYHRFPELLPDYLNGPYKIPEEVYLPRFYDLARLETPGECNEEAEHDAAPNRSAAPSLNSTLSVRDSEG